MSVTSDRGRVILSLGKGGGPPLPSSKRVWMWKHYSSGGSPPPSIGYDGGPSGFTLVLHYSMFAGLAVLIAVLGARHSLRGNTGRPKGFAVQDHPGQQTAA
jgi:hypothetical protein